MDIICISSIDWDFNWQGHQEIMSRFARQGHRVLFVENTGVRRPAFRDLPRLLARIRNWNRGVKGFRREMDRLYVYSPMVLPFPESRVARWANAMFLVRSLKRWMRAASFGRPLLWTFLPTRLVADLIDKLEPTLVVYYCIADFEQLVSNTKKLNCSERMLLDRSDVVFVQGEVLRERCMPHPDISIFPFGVSLQAFSPDVPRAAELASLKRPIIGYLGGVHRHVDFELLARVAQETIGTVALVGPVQESSPILEAQSNVVFLGQQPHVRVCEFLQGFDVALIPYALNEYTRTVYPTKLNEYLAMGLPVVSTDLPEVKRFSEKHPGVVKVAGTHDAFATAVRESLDDHTPEAVRARQRAAADYDWESTITQMGAIIDRAFQAKAKTVVGWEDSLRRLYRVARRRTAVAVIAVAAAYAVVFYTPTLWAIAAPLTVVESPRPADAIVVFAGGVGESGQAGGGYQERVKHAVDLYRAGQAPRMIFSSGYVFAFREPEIMKALAEASGVPSEAILLEQKAANTHENVKFVSAILERHGWRSVLLVSSPYHMRRALLTWHRISPATTVIAAPVPQSQFYDHNLGATAEQIKGIVHEYAAIVVYWWRGWI